MTNVMTSQTSRQQILEYLGQHNGSSAADISRSLRVTAANVRYHLGILEQDGRVKRLGTRPEKGPGRPVAIYGSTKATGGNNMAGLADSLLGMIIRGNNNLDAEQFPEALAAELMPVEQGAAGNIARRLAQTISKLSKLGYAARWEAHAAAPRIIFDQCPYAEIIGRHPELCKMDAAILRQQLDGSVEQIAKLEKNARGTRYCQFILRKF